jgi:regulator of replication initiation timing
MEEARSVEELEVTIRSLREENERLKAELSRLRRNLDERPPHYL